MLEHAGNAVGTRQRDGPGGFGKFSRSLRQLTCGDGESGEVLIYRHGTSGWAVEQRIAPAPGQIDEVGTTTQIDAAGDTLLVGRYAGGGAYDNLRTQTKLDEKSFVQSHSTQGRM